MPGQREDQRSAQVDVEHRNVDALASDIDQIARALQRRRRSDDLGPLRGQAPGEVIRYQEIVFHHEHAATAQQGLVGRRRCH